MRTECMNDNFVVFLCVYCMSLFGVHIKFHHNGRHFILITLHICFQLHNSASKWKRCDKWTFIHL